MNAPQKQFSLNRAASRKQFPISSQTRTLPDVTDAISGHTTSTKVFENHDRNGNLIDTQTVSKDNGTEMTHKPVTRFLYDQLNRRMETFACDNAGANPEPMGRIQYNWSGRAWLEVDADNHAKAMVYNDAGQLAWVVTDVDPNLSALPASLPAGWNMATPGSRLADSTATGYRYNELGQQTAQVDAKGHAMTFAYDELGRRTRRYLPSSTGPTSDVEKWEYDHAEASDTAPPAGKRINKVLHTDFLSQELITTFDNVGRLDLKKKRVGDTTTLLVDYGYSPAGQRAYMRDNLDSGSPRETRYAYDDRNRLRVKQSPEGTLTYSYDDTTDNLTGISTRYDYDEALWAATSCGAYRYDPATWETLANRTPRTTGAFMTYTYDDRHRLTKVNPDGVNLADLADAKYSYNSVGSQASNRYRNGVETAYTYNTRNQLRRIRSYLSASPASLRANFDYDEAEEAEIPAITRATWGSRLLATSGLRRGMVENIGGTIRWVGYTYDNLNRLTKEALHAANWGAEAGSVQYDGNSGYTDAGFDPVGNHQQRTVSGTFVGVGVSAASGINYDVNDRLDNDATASTPSTYFDANGNTLKPDLNGDGVVDSAENVYTYGYDRENHLISVNDGAGKTITIIYDGDGNRVRKTVTSGTTSTTIYLVDDRNPTGYAQVLEECDGSGSTLVTYVYGLDLISQTRSGNTHYYGCDGLGTVRYLTRSSDGAITDTYTYDAFGILTVQTPAPGSQTQNTYRYTGEQWDADLEMYYLRARYYKPELGRFWTMDSYEGNALDPLSLHKFLYGADDPANVVDPSGKGVITSASG